MDVYGPRDLPRPIGQIRRVFSSGIWLAGGGKQVMGGILFNFMMFSESWLCS